jgi:hypothetical protein
LLEFIPDSVNEEAVQQKYGKDKVLAELRAGSREIRKYRLADFPVVEKLETFMEDVQ